MGTAEGSGHPVEGTLAALVADPSQVAGVPAEHLPALLAQLAGLQGLLTARLLAVPPSRDGQGEGLPSADRLLTPAEAAPLLGVTPRWLYRHHKRLPFARRLSRKALRFSEAGLRKYLAAKRA